MEQRYKLFLQQAKEFIPSERIFTDDLHTLAWGTDAGFYRYLPKIVVRSRTEEEVAHLVRLADRHGVPVTFRAAGTSLSGQAVTDSVLIVAGQHWEKYEVSSDGSVITLQPGVIGERVNRILKPYGRIFTPDPASKNSAMVGGIVINNASGMNCGTHANSDRMLQSVRLVMADGTVLDTGDRRSCDSFRRSHPQFLAKIEQLRLKVVSDSELVARISKKYSIKCVTGLNIHPFVVYTDPFKIITHLIVGSEGTLAFASEFKIATGHLYPFSASAMLYFADMVTACEAVVALKNGPVYSAEMLDPKSLASVNDTTGVGLTAILIETKADTAEELDANIATIMEVVKTFELSAPARFSTDPEECARYWGIRSGIFPSVGGTRPLGTTVIIEDIAFHIEDLPQATADLTSTLHRHGYDDACIYGHALEGNYHFILAQSFDSEEEILRYKRLMEDITTLVVDKYDGSLKAEHGTGRNMAPFVKREWGVKAYGIMQEVKQLFDPKNLFNPGVIFNDDPECYLKHFKPLPLANPAVDKCIECGFCEVRCLSTGFTLSARQRIVVQREISRLTATGEDQDRLKRLIKQFRYSGAVTCATDGLCSLACPMSIKAGKIVLDFRATCYPKGGFGYHVGDFAARNINHIAGLLRPILSTASAAGAILGDKATRSIGKGLHRLGAPLWTSATPTAHYAHLHTVKRFEKKVVYFPSCINRTMGASKTDAVKVDLVDKMVDFLQKAGWEVIFPENMQKLCCGMIWASKGMPDIAQRKTAELEEALFATSDGGAYPVMCDQSPCLQRLRQSTKRLKLYEPAEFINDFVAEDLDFTLTDEPIALHITCSSRMMGIADKIENLARRCSTRVLVPEGVECCGFAGDKGFTHPEMNRYALRRLRSQIEAEGIKRGFSNSRTCEVGLTNNTGIPYQSIVFLVDECTKPKR